MTLLELYEEKYGENKYEVVAATVNRRLRELSASVKPDDEVEFIKTNSIIGFDLYKRSIILLMLKAAKDVLGKPEGDYKIDVMYSISKGYFCRLLDTDDEMNDELIGKIKARMEELVEQDLPIEKMVCSTAEMREEFARRDLPGKASLLKFRQSSKINIYSLGGYKDYFYGYMVPSTGFLKTFDLVRYDDGFVVILPQKSTGELPAKEADGKYEFPNKLYSVLRTYEDWGQRLNCSYVGDVNNVIVNGGVNNMILVQEALMEKQIGDMAKDIVEGGKKLVLIAGPSSSGKTTFSNRLSAHMMAYGIHPHPIAMDNFFKNRDETPRDENGDLDFECLEALDLVLLEDTMTRLLRGEEVEMPTFDFTVGKKVFNGDTLKLGDNDVIVMEGIHALNPESTKTLSKDSCYKIYISALTQLNIDEHNQISTTDTRLLRRIVRDARTRGHSATKTIKMWPSVRRGEEKYIFPFQEEADAIFNSALIYELSAIKTFAEPLLYGVDEDSDEYYEAKRLLKFLGYFLGIDVQNVPQTSLMREFIGGGCFKV
ncbi:MAG: nucleoside kinase [Eubacterium sp.]|nr:nucleoside kinase [Eubacterium sp.]